VPSIVDVDDVVGVAAGVAPYGAAEAAGFGVLGAGDANGAGGDAGRNDVGAGDDESGAGETLAGNVCGGVGVVRAAVSAAAPFDVGVVGGGNIDAAGICDSRGGARVGCP
jgi:hypothetical protein